MKEKDDLKKTPQFLCGQPVSGDVIHLCMEERKFWRRGISQDFWFKKKLKKHFLFGSNFMLNEKVQK